MPSAGKSNKLVMAGSDNLDASINWGGGLKSQGIIAKRGKNQFSLVDSRGSVVPFETQASENKPVNRLSMFDAQFTRK